MRYDPDNVRDPFDAERMQLRASVFRLGRLGILAGAAVAGLTPAAGQQPVVSLTLQSGESENPHTSPEDVEAGARVYSRSCAICHGGDATGGRGPDLTRGVFRHGSSDRALFRNILLGIPRTGMAGVYRPDTDIWRVISYIRSLNQGAVEVEVPGNPTRGRRLYLQRGSCPDCHRIDGAGGRLGPDLSEIGWLRSPEHLRSSLLVPNEVVDPAYRTVRVATRDGREVQGILRNEDTYSVQLLDELENLRAFMKRDLAALEKPEVSLMPGFEGFFDQRELDHLVAFLYSLKGNPR